MSTTKPGIQDALGVYRAKRRADGTTEPLGSDSPAPRPGLFVVHQHAATAMHWDLRLELDGVLLSWAVPKGPSLDPGEKRLAVQTEPHPMEYADFEGVIPKGNYGAGEMIVWDRGVWVNLPGDRHGMEFGKLLFDLKGHKLRGRWTLVKTKRNEKDWLLIKKPDAAARTEGEYTYDPGSIFSGLTVEDLRSGSTRAAELRAELEEMGVPRRAVRPAEVRVMLAETARGPFSDSRWLFELKYDGYRTVLAREADGTPRIFYRSGREATAQYPDMARALAKQPFDNLVLDAEVVVLDEDARPSFQSLQKRAGLSRRQDIERATVEHPATLYAFDLLGFEDFDLRGLPLLERKRLLQRVLPRAGPLRFTEHISGELGEAMFEKVRRMGLEGLMAKKAESPYTPGRSSDWLKVTVDHSGDFVVVGFKKPQGSRHGFGGLIVAVWEGGRLVQCGRVGSGFSDRDLQDITERLTPDIVEQPQCAGEPPTPLWENVWVTPRLVVEVRFKAWTDHYHLRQPVFLRLMDDKRFEDCVRPAADRVAGEPPPPPVSEPKAEQQRRVPYTNRTKMFWPAAGYTKGDLIDYYEGVAPWLLPYLIDRPLVLTRYPDGIGGKSFFQKDAPDFLPGWVRRERMWSEGTQRHIDYVVADSPETLGYLANMGAIPLHMWSSAVGAIAAPDWTILDLDPKETPFSLVIEIAQAIHALLDDIGLPNFVKTTGSTGLHILVPLGQQCTYEQARWLALLVGKVVCSEGLHPIATTARSMRMRAGKVYIDCGQNAYGQTIVTPYSVRPRPGAPVSMPLEWSEVRDGLDQNVFTIATAMERLRTQSSDPLRPVTTLIPDLTGALDRLSERFGAASQ